MNSITNSNASSSEQNAPLDIKPLRSLAPMRPPSLGLGTNASPTTDSIPLVCVTPFGSYITNSDSRVPPSFLPMFPNVAQTKNQTAVYATPLSTRSKHVIIDSNGKSVSIGFRSKGTDERKPKRGKPTQVYDRSLVLPLSNDPRESVEAILILFDALRRRAQQLEDGSEGIKRPDLKVGPIMTDHGLRINEHKMVGPVPGVEVGDIFYFRFEMNLIGIHHQIMGGIDTATIKFGNEEDTVATCIVSSGYYENHVEDAETIIYSGQGGSGKDDQKLERGNLALERSLHRGSEVRVIRSAKDFTCANGKIYIYDGIYKIHESWVDKGKTGFNIFKFKLLREPGQPIGYAVWKMTEKWLENPSSRGRVILPDLSSGSENIPVCLVNEVDSEKGPSHFKYATKVNYLSRISSLKPVHKCMCHGVCLPRDGNCSCAQENGGDLPYSSNGLLVSRMPLIYECSNLCCCTSNCRNRLAQRGIKLNFEVFKTNDRGWGLRSWHPIRAGSFICEYTGEVIDKITADLNSEHNEYIFHGLIEDKKVRWNYIPELFDESRSGEPSETPRPLPFVINAKNMGNIARFMNHSCSPNVFWQPVLHDHSDLDYPHIMFFAMKHIPPMTELTYDYGLTKGDPFVVSRRTKKCLCGSSKCRGVFG